MKVPEASGKKKKAVKGGGSEAIIAMYLNVFEGW